MKHGELDITDRRSFTFIDRSRVAVLRIHPIQLRGDWAFPLSLVATVSSSPLLCPRSRPYTERLPIVFHASFRLDDYLDYGLSPHIYIYISIYLGVIARDRDAYSAARVDPFSLVKGGKNALAERLMVVVSGVDLWVWITSHRHQYRSKSTLTQVLVGMFILVGRTSAEIRVGNGLLICRPSERICCAAVR